ncbi:MAG: primosomal protein N' [Akkermansiaceae bacterium]|nr:primosomal protein N' [Akkermansiaceae bacterium]
MQLVATVLIDGASSKDLQFDYAVPAEWAGKAKPGMRVRIPLRNRQAIGTITAVREEADHPERPAGRGGKRTFALKPIAGVLDEAPLLTAPLLKLAEWISGYYLASRDSTLKAMIPQPVRSEEKGEKTRKNVRLVYEPDLETLESLKKRAPKQAELVEFLISRPGQQGLLADLTGLSGFGRPSITALEKAGMVVVEDEVVTRDPFADEVFVQSAPMALNPEQERSRARIVAAAAEAETERPPRPILLFGVTGSGKTEVYLQAIQRVVDEGRGAIVLVPEISLTPQTADQFKKRFAAMQDQVAILHSHLSAGERHDEWRKVLRREARIVIGARSAIFAPVENLGLIVVDEEHENTYKQESPPRYQARDVAVVRGHLEKCAVVLGSATPSLESWKNALTGKYERLDLTQRVDDRELPLIRVIDMRLETRKNRGLAILSSKLRESIESRLADRQQVILFLNRRGFARSLICPECGLVMECRHCSLALTYHREEDKLICHLCGYAQVTPRKCPECGGRAISLAGFGTEKVEAVLNEVFKGARIARIDTDTMRRKNDLKLTLNAFKAGKTDILIGTQMIAKGLHFPNVTLVGILNADIGLHIPDFRASERTFQLLTQVAGRAGRGELKGEVVVQTFTPHAPAVQFARHHDYTGFAEQEIQLRERLEFPPFRHLAMITSRSVHRERAEFSLQTLHRRMKRHLPDGLTITEPLPSPLIRSHDQWRFQFSMRGANAKRLTGHIGGVLGPLSFPEDVIVTVDMDAHNLS